MAQVEHVNCLTSTPYRGSLFARAIVFFFQFTIVTCFIDQEINLLHSAHINCFSYLKTKIYIEIISDIESQNNTVR